MSGTSFGAKQRWFDGMLRRAILQDEGKRLRAAAEALLNAAADGQAWAIDKLADRLDGKPGQSVDVTVSAKSPEEMSLAELAAELARQTASRGEQAHTSPDQPTGLH